MCVAVYGCVWLCVAVCGCEWRVRRNYSRMALALSTNMLPLCVRAFPFGSSLTAAECAYLCSLAFLLLIKQACCSRAHVWWLGPPCACAESNLETLSLSIRAVRSIFNCSCAISCLRRERVQPMDLPEYPSSQTTEPSTSIYTSEHENWAVYPMPLVSLSS